MNGETLLTPLLDRFLETVVFEVGLAEHTLSAYAADLRRYLEHLEALGIEDAGEVVREDIVDHLGALYAAGMSPRSCARHLSAIRHFHRHLAEEGVTRQNPAADLESVRLPRSLPHFLSAEEVDRLLDAPDTSTEEGVRDAAILALFYACGLRISELCALPLRHLSIEEGAVRVRGKGGKDRLVPLGRRAITRLRTWLALRD